MLFSNEICAINKNDVTGVFYIDKEIVGKVPNF